MSPDARPSQTHNKGGEGAATREKHQCGHLKVIYLCYSSTLYEMKIKYKESIIAFIDVLGFSDLVFSDDQSKIANYFTYVFSDFQQVLSSKKFKFMLISDSIVVSAAKNHNNLQELTFVLAKIQAQLLCRGILMRGAVSFGKLYVNKSNNVIVGPGLISAFALEKEANVPRIILDRRLIIEFNMSSQKFLDSLNTEFKKRYGEDDEKVKTTNDGVFYVNYFRKFSRSGGSFKLDNIDSVIGLFKKYYYSQKYFMKYQWVLQNLILELSLAEEHYEKHPIKKGKKRLKQVLALKTALLKL
jgi:hypothetical protein